MPRVVLSTGDAVWLPTRVRQVHCCAECQRDIGRGSIAYRAVCGELAASRICAACIMMMLTDGRAHEHYQ